MPTITPSTANKKSSVANNAATTTTAAAATATAAASNTNKEGGFKFLRRDEGRLSYSVPVIPESPSKCYSGTSPRVNNNNSDRLTRGGEAATTVTTATTPRSAAAAISNTSNVSTTPTATEQTTSSNNDNVNAGSAQANRERRASKSLREIIAEDMRNAKNHDYLDEVVVVVPKKAPPSSDKFNTTNSTTPIANVNNNKNNNNKFSNKTIEGDTFNRTNQLGKGDDNIHKPVQAVVNAQQTQPTITKPSSSSTLSSQPQSPASRANVHASRLARQGNSRINGKINNNNNSNTNNNNNNNNNANNNLTPTAGSNTKSAAAAANRNSISRRPAWIDPEIPARQAPVDEEEASNHINMKDSRSHREYTSLNVKNLNNNYSSASNKRTNERDDDDEYDQGYNNNNNNNNNNNKYSNENASKELDFNNNEFNSTSFTRSLMPSHLQPSLNPPRRTMSAPRRFNDVNMTDSYYYNYNSSNINDNNNNGNNMNMLPHNNSTSPSLMPMTNQNYLRRPRPRDLSVPAGRTRMFTTTNPITQQVPTKTNTSAAEAEEAELMMQLEREVRAAQEEREQYMNLMESLNAEKSEFETYKFDMQQQLMEERAAWESTRQLGEQAAQKDVKTMNERYRSVSALLTSERATNARLMHENNSLRSQLEELTVTLREAQMIHKTEVARLRRDIDSLTRRNAELLTMTKEQQLRLLASNEPMTSKANSQMSTSYNSSVNNTNNNVNVNVNNRDIVDENEYTHMESTQNTLDDLATVKSYSTNIDSQNCYSHDRSNRNRPRSHANELTSDTLPVNSTLQSSKKRSASSFSALASNRDSHVRGELLSANRVGGGRLSESQPSLHSAPIRAQSTNRMYSNRPTNTSASSLTNVLTANASNIKNNNNNNNENSSNTKGTTTLVATKNIIASIPTLNLPNHNNNNNNNTNTNSEIKNSGINSAKENTSEVETKIGRVNTNSPHTTTSTTAATTKLDKLANNNMDSSSSSARTHHDVKGSAEKRVINLSPLHASEIESAELEEAIPTSVILDFTPRRSDDSQRERRAREVAAILQKEEEERQQRRLQRERLAQERKQLTEEQLQILPEHEFSHGSSTTKGKAEAREKSHSQESNSHTSKQGKSKLAAADKTRSNTNAITTTTTTSYSFSFAGSNVTPSKDNSVHLSPAHKVSQQSQKTSANTPKTTTNTNKAEANPEASIVNAEIVNAAKREQRTTAQPLFAPRNPKLDHVNTSSPITTSKSSTVSHKKLLNNEENVNVSNNKIEEEKSRNSVANNITDIEQTCNSGTNCSDDDSNKNNNSNNNNEKSNNAKHNMHQIPIVNDQVHKLVDNHFSIREDDNVESKESVNAEVHANDEKSNKESSVDEEHDLNATQRPSRISHLQRIPTCAELIGEMEQEPEEHIPNDSLVAQNAISNNPNKREELYNSGKRVVYYSNGTVKTILPSGHTILHFTNKDVKTTFPSGTSTYWYEAAQTTHTQKSDGVQIFQFHATGQTERHMPDGSKEILYPDGSFKIVYTDGTDETLLPESDEEVSSNERIE